MTALTGLIQGRQLKIKRHKLQTNMKLTLVYLQGLYSQHVSDHVCLDLCPQVHQATVKTVLLAPRVSGSPRRSPTPPVKH